MRKKDFIDTRDHQPIVDAIKPLLAGKSPMIQSSVLADLLSIWLAGIRPDLREELLQGHIRLVRELIPLAEREQFGARGHPGRQRPKAIAKKNPWAL
jgi:hypothetical protein